MNTLEAIFSRRSIRKYTDEAIDDGLLEKALAAAMMAPSAGNQQPWHFVVITERSLLARIPEIHPHASMAKDAQAAILVCGDLSLEKHQGYWMQDCAAATQNLLLAIHALGLGAVWTGVYPREERVANFRTLFGLPESVVPLALVPVGHPVERPSAQDRFRKERVHMNSW